jgi:hypothetical protein
MRIYDPRLGRFLSTDPLTRSYPMLTPYQFASNRPIDGIDLDGLEFLKSDEARIEVINGGVYLKVENLRTIAGRAYTMANERGGGIRTWNENGIQQMGNAEKTKIGEFYFSKNGAPLNEMPKLAVLNNPADVNEQISDGPADPIRLPAGRDINGNPLEPAIATPSVTSKVFAKGILVIDGAIAIAQRYINYKIEGEQGVINGQLKHQFGYALNALLEGVNKKMVPQKYQNTKDLSSILNVVLSGVNNTDNEDILKIGMDIYNKYKPEKVNKPTGLDHMQAMPDRSIEVIRPIQNK